ncbi:leucine-rich repeat protein kinase family protein [Actinidia rufa]|uniref:non-specific serine/threonine protein kinase n=1 Tax=Actinidia rufa TaxID=165716 RepID=A0A7J0EDP9_9ERIC|nr:leucine-rich repeat protein kinase family protein [Actinidia rufa]
MLNSGVPATTIPNSRLEGNETDLVSLLALKTQILEDPFHAMSSWNDSVQFCQWEGVTCGHRHQRVTALDLQSRKLVGSISPYVGNLSFLRELQLQNNSFGNEIPLELGRLQRLQILMLSNNSLGGQLRLVHCQRSQGVYIHDNNLTGSIDPFGNLTSLQELSAAENIFDGGIPNGFGRLKNLQKLALGINRLSGVIPPSLFNLSSLTMFDVTGNQIEGSLPWDLGYNLPNIEFLNISDNQFIGSIPVSMSNASKLHYLVTVQNKLTGKVPNFERLLQNLDWLSISDNQLGSGEAGDLSFSLVFDKCHQLTDNNRISGSIQPGIANILNLQSLYIQGINNLQGSIPSSLGECENLQLLFLSQNNLIGTIPKEVVAISSLSIYLHLSQNQLSGSLPVEVGNLINLGSLDVSGNLLLGEIPSTLGSCVVLETLRMGSNFFQGRIPSSLGFLRGIRERDLSNNNLSGEIPEYLEGFDSLQKLNLSFNNFEGLVLVVCALYICWFRKTTKDNSSADSENSLFRVTYQSLLQATNGFSSSNLIGAGSFGSVYKGVLDGRIVAVKVLNLLRQGASKSFISECEALRNIRHRNLVKVLTASSAVDYQGNDFKALVYEFMVNGSLEDALNYLHNHGQTPIVHCDLKPSNILLDKEMTAHVGDFGLAKFLPDAAYDSSINETGSIGIRGSIGYTAPEYAMGSVVSTYGDVYSFGILLLEMFTGKRPTDEMFKDALSIHGFVFKREVQSSESSLPEPFSKVSYKRLHEVTDRFSSANLIGVGSFGSVYKGILDQDEITIAVKVFNLQRRGAFKTFVVECEALRNIRHRNLVKIVTSCSSDDFQGNDFKALVYEFMPNGSLERWLHPANRGTTIGEIEFPGLTLLQRISIAIDVASAINYLHHHCPMPVIHCDLKPSNILLGSGMVACVGDFGLARFRPELTDPKQSSSIGIRGTIGYAAPEYGLGSKVSTSGDVYSYGILLLEMMTGKRPTDPMFGEGFNLHNFARMALPDRVMEIVEPLLLKNDEDNVSLESDKDQSVKWERDGNIKEHCLISLIKIGVTCSMESPHGRMDIRNVVHDLNLVRDLFQKSLN